MQLKFLKKNIKAENLLREKGAIALPTIILIGGIILEIALTLSLVSYLLLQSGAGSKFAAEALVIAQAGIDDSIVKIIRNNRLGYPSPYQYTLTVDAIRKAEIIVCYGLRITNNNCDVTKVNNNKTNVISLGRVFNKNRKIEAIIDVNPNTGEIKVESIEEITL